MLNIQFKMVGVPEKIMLIFRLRYLHGRLNMFSQNDLFDLGIIKKNEIPAQLWNVSSIWNLIFQILPSTGLCLMSWLQLHRLCSFVYDGGDFSTCFVPCDGFSDHEVWYFELRDLGLRKQWLRRSLGTLRVVVVSCFTCLLAVPEMLLRSPWCVSP